MSLRQHIVEKRHAARTLRLMIRHFRNWPDVWQAYRCSAELPPIEFRSGFILGWRVFSLIAHRLSAVPRR